MKRLIATLLTFGCSEFVDRVPADASAAADVAPDIVNLCAKAACSDGDPCTSDRCNPTTGACEHSAVPDGASCDDGQFCTADDRCAAGACVGAATVCPGDSATCTEGVCDEAAGACTTRVAADDASCDDGNTCTEGERCAAGGCAGGTAVVCPDDAVGCSAQACVSGQGCVATVRDDGAACDDSDPCTVNDICTSGACAGAPRDCSELDEVCRVGACDSTAGQCVKQNRPPSPCDDADLCTINDTCTGGQCKGEQRDCSAADGPCALGVCETGAGGCVPQAIAEGEPCEDDDLCSLTSKCQSGLCALVTSVDCSGLSGPCSLGACVVSTGQCTSQPLLEGQPCTDGNACTTGDQCTAGSCVGAPKDCGNAVVPCWSVKCSAADGNCVAGPDTLLDGSPCEDGEFCTVSGQCSEGSCSSSPRDCASLAGACDVSTCDEVLDQCISTPANEGDPCSDGNACTAADICVSGVCSGLDSVDCSGLDDACRAGACDPVAGGCVAQPREDGTACSDGSLCTQSDACASGECVGVAVDCSSLTSQCAAGQCEASTGCVAAPVPDGSSCSDGLDCTQGDSCLGGSCASGTPVGCPCPSPPRALSLSGDCAVAPGRALLDSTRGFTVAFWLRTTSTESARVLDQRLTASPGEADWSITYEAPGGIGQLRFQYGNTVGNDSQLGMTGVALNDDKWHYLALVRDGDDLRWWVDGVGQPVATAANLLSLTNTAPLAIGCSRFGGEGFVGALDELAIWSYPRYRTPHEGPGRHPVTAGLVALYRFDEDPPAPVDVITGAAATVGVGVSSTLGANDADSGCCGNGFVEQGEACEPAVVGCAASCEFPSIPAQSADFDGVTGCLVVDSTGLLNTVSQLTIEFWLQTTQANAVLLDKRSADGLAGWRVELDGTGKPSLAARTSLGAPLSFAAPTPVNDGNWHHVALINFAGNKLRWFVDGVPATPGTLDVAGLGNSYTLRLGCDSGAARLHGRLDGVHLSRTLRYATAFVPATTPSPDANSELLYTFDLPAVGGIVVDLGPGLHDGATTAGVAMLPVAP